MTFTFDGPNKLIICDAGVTAFTAEGVYSRWKDWLGEAPLNAAYEPAFENSIGGNPLGSGVSLGSYIFITNGWKIRPQEASHRLDVSGNLFPVPDTADVFEPTVGNYNVVIAMNTSSLTQRVIVGGGIQATVSDVADAVWDKNLSGATSNTAGETLNRAQAGAEAAAALSA